MVIQVGNFDPETGGIKKGKPEESNSCLDCDSHEVRPDPDPFDSFRDTDFKVYCKELGEIVSRGCEVPSAYSDTQIPKNCPKF